MKLNQLYDLMHQAEPINLEPICLSTWCQECRLLYKLDNSSLKTSKMLVIEHPSARWDKICSLVEKNQNSDVFNFCNCTILKRNLTTKRERIQEKL